MTTWTVPSGVKSITVEVWGAGGGGAVASTAAGGGGGGYARSVLLVTPGDVINYEVGAGGGPGNAGGDSDWDNDTVLAAGGNPGDGGTGGAGGSSNTGDVTFNGGNGGDGGDGDNGDSDDDGEAQPEEEQPEADQPEEEPEAPETDEPDTDDTGGSGGDGGSGDTPDTRVQVVVDPDNAGNAVNGSGSARWTGTIYDSDIILGTSGGFFRGVSVQNANRDAVSTLGDTDDGYPSGRVAFIIANVGPEDGSDGATVRVSAQLFADGEAISTAQLRCPYRVVDSDGNRTARGTNLLAGTGPRLPDGHVIEVVIVFDTHNGVDDLERIDNLRFSAVGVN